MYKIKFFLEWLVTGVISLGLCFSFTTDNFAQNKASEIYKRSAPAIVLIRTNTGGGSGFIVSSSGIIVTALHVVEGASRVSIKTQKGEVFEDVLLLAKDERRDLAILKISSSNLPFAELQSLTVNPGEPVIVLGNPLVAKELEVSISTGIISGIRNLRGKHESSSNDCANFSRQ